MEVQRASEIRLCGRLIVEIDGRRLEAALPSRQGRLVFAYLVLHRRRPVSRDELIEALWPSRAPASPDALLTGLLSRLRGALPAGMLKGRAQLELRLPPEVWIDMEIAAAAPARAQDALAADQPGDALTVASAALEILEQPLLPEIDRQWVDQRRRELEEVELALLELTARAGLAAGGSDLKVGEAAVRRLIEREPFRESAYALLMELHAARGDVAQALRVYDHLRTLLRDELGAVPAAHVRALSERLLQDGGGRARTVPPATQPDPRPRVPAQLRVPLPFVGRAAELAKLLRAIRTPVGGSARVVLVTGEAGIGKTSLAARAASAVMGMSVLYGRCDEEPLGPYQPFAEALRDLLADAPDLLDGPVVAVQRPELARILPELGDAASEVDDRDRHRLFEAVAALMDALESPVLFVLDDLQWAEAATLAMLRYVVRRARAPIVVLATLRDTELDFKPLGELIVDLRREGALERVRLAGLDAAATRELIAVHSDAAPHPEFVRRTHARTGGNPFFVEQLVRAGADTVVPEGVKELITQRVARLPPAAGETLRIAATIGGEFELGLLERLADGRDRTLVAVDTALNAGMLIEVAGVAGRLAFPHALVREAVYESMSATRRATLHQRIGESLESVEPAPAAAVAHHFLCARHVAGADRAVHWALAAAEQAAAAFAWEDEVAHYESALDALDETDSADDATRCRILLRLADRLIPLGGDFTAACLRAAELAKQHGWSETLAEAANDIARAKADPDAVPLLEEALAALGESDSPWRARILGRIADTLALDGREPERADALSREALRIARRLDDPVALIAALDSRSLALAQPEHLPERLRLTSEALALADDLPDTAWRHNLRRELIVLYTEQGDLAAARDHLDVLADNLAETRLHGTYREADVLRLRAAFALVDGRLPDAERHAQASQALRERLGDPDTAWSIALTLPIRLEQDRGDELADAVTERAQGARSPWLWRAALSLLHARAGRRAEAHAELSALVADECAAIPRLHDWLPTLVLLADACAELAEPTHADTLRRLLAPHTDRVAALLFATAPLGPVARPLGRLAMLHGPTADAIALLERAVSSSQATSAPIWVAHAQADLSAALVRRGAPGDHDRAEDLLTRAHTCAGALALRRLARDIDHARAGADDVGHRASRTLAPRHA